VIRPWEERFEPTGAEAPLLLLNPGPINVSRGVAEAQLRGDLCHREPEFFLVQRAIRELLLEAFAPAGGWTSVLLTGSGTAALESALSSCLGPDEELLILRNGVYGERIESIARAHGIPHHVVDRGWFEPHDPQGLARALEACPRVGAVASVVHETTTGLLNPVEALGEVCRERGKLFLVDAISAIGGERLDLAWGVDVVVGTANKCIRGLPGMSFVLLRDEVRERIEDYAPRTLYLHLPTYHRKQEADGTPFTPAVQVAYAFEAALRELVAEGVAARVAHMRAVSDLLREGCARLGLKLLLDPSHLSLTITTYELPAGWTYPALHDALKERGFVIYAGQGELAQRAFRISNMGVLSSADYERFLAVLGEVLA
jgi:2-aminoethylphosphonate-pyruvate transaminase